MDKSGEASECIMFPSSGPALARGDGLSSHLDSGMYIKVVGAQVLRRISSKMPLHFRIPKSKQDSVCI